MVLKYWVGKLSSGEGVFKYGNVGVQLQINARVLRGKSTRTVIHDTCGDSKQYEFVEQSDTLGMTKTRRALKRVTYKRQLASDTS